MEETNAKRFLTEQEAATALRRSKSAIKRLRLSGQLPYLPGKPVLIEAADLEAYVQRMKDRAGSAAAEKAQERRTFSELSPAEQAASARAWALRQKLKPPRVRRKPPKPG
jgi:hypothetical protein